MTAQPPATAIELPQTWRTLFDLGFSVIPIEHGGKQPSVKWKPFQKARAPIETVHQWASRQSNIGIVTGSISGLLVLDGDTDEAVSEIERRGVPETLEVNTAKGRHWYFCHPGGEIGNRAGIFPGADIRGDGGYVVAPGSKHPSGALYTWRNPPGLFDLAPPPAWLLETLDERGQGTEEAPKAEPVLLDRAGGCSDTPYGLAALEGECAAIRSATNGLQEKTLNDAALKIGTLVAGGELTAQTARSKLIAAGLAMTSHREDAWTLAAVAEKVEHGLNDGARQPRVAPEQVSYDPEPGDKEEAARPHADSIFALFDIDELEAMPPPSWLIHELIPDEGLAIVYGGPGENKTFITLDMALRVSHGMDWHGIKAATTGVLYIAGEGARGIGKRVKGWRREHGREGVAAPFLLVPLAVHLLDEKERAKLIRTIDEAVRRAGFKIGLIVIDTVSRALAGGDENGQEAMGQFVAACDQIRQHAGGALIGVHHCGKERDKGMRGSTVLLGACDASILVFKNDQITTLKTEKQKDAEEAAPIRFEHKQVSWVEGPDEEQSTLVPIRTGAAPQQAEDETLSQEQIEKAFGIMAIAWDDKKPLSTAPQTRNAGRFAPSVLARAIGCRQPTIAEYLRDWLETKCLEVDVCDSHSKAKGIRVLAIPGRME